MNKLFCGYCSNYAPLIVFIVFASVLAPSSFSQTISHYQTVEEFCGPFPSWKNVKTDFGAVGNGTTDDAPAIQAALTAMQTVSTNTWNVLYFPAGTYLINSTLVTTRVNHNDYLGVCIIGQHPDSVVVKWNGPSGNNMFNSDMWFAKISRMTFNGNSTANIGLARDGSFSTYCELSDLYFKDMRIGIQFGGVWSDQGQAEHMITRCRFLRCGTSGYEGGIAIKCYNSLDLYVWYCSFEDCYNGIAEVSGNFHAYENVFLRTMNTDCNIFGTFDGFHVNHSIVNNISIASRRFLGIDYAKWSTAALIQGNKIYDWTGPVGDSTEYALATGASGGQLVLDNTFRGLSADTRTPVHMHGWDQMLVGNTFTTSDYVDSAWHSDTIPNKQRYRLISNRVVNRSTLPDPTLSLPSAPLNHNRTVYEVGTGAGNGLQAMITAAANAPAGSKPIVHIPKGPFSISTKIVVPANSDMQIVGDGAGDWGTTLVGPTTDTALVLRAPSKVTIRDLNISGFNTLVIEDSDLPGGRIFGDQLQFQGRDVNNKCNSGFFVNGIDNTDITIIGSGFSYVFNGVRVKGGPVLGSGTATTGQFLLLGGASTHGENFYDVQNNGKLVATGYWYEGDYAFTKSSLNLTSASSGTITIAAMLWAVGSNTLTLPIVSIDIFNGSCTMVSNHLVHYSATVPMHWVRIKGSTQNTKFLFAENVFALTRKAITTVDSMFRDSSTAGQYAMQNCGYWGNFNDTLPNVTNKQANVEADSNFILQNLEQLRTMQIRTRAALSGANAQYLTDVNLIRAMVNSGIGGTSITVVKKSLPTGMVYSKGGIVPGRFCSIVKVLYTGSMPELPQNVKRVSVYNVQGQLLDSRTILNNHDVVLAQKQMHWFARKGVTILKYWL